MITIPLPQLLADSPHPLMFHTYACCMPRVWAFLLPSLLPVTRLLNIGNIQGIF